MRTAKTQPFVFIQNSLPFIAAETVLNRTQLRDFDITVMTQICTVYDISALHIFPVYDFMASVYTTQPCIIYIIMINSNIPPQALAGEMCDEDSLPPEVRRR